MMILEGVEGEVRDSCDITVVAPQITIRKECKANDPVVNDMTIVNRMERATHVITVTNGEVNSQDVVVVDVPAGEVVAAIDRLPLALELAAGMTELLPLSELRSRLTRPLDLLVGPRRDHPERHTSLRIALSGSWELLDEAERRALAAASASLNNRTGGG